MGSKYLPETIVVNSYDVQTGRLADTALTKEAYERIGGVPVRGQVRGNPVDIGSVNGCNPGPGCGRSEASHTSIARNHAIVANTPAALN